MLKLSSVILLLFLTFLTSCSTLLQERLDVNTVEKPRPELNLQQPEKLNLDNVQYYVITPENANEVFKEIKEKGFEPVIIGTTSEGFAFIVSNNIKIQQLIEKYQNYIIQQNNYYSPKPN